MNLIKYAGYYCTMAAILAWGMVQPAFADAADAASAPAATEQIFARINGKPVSMQEFWARYNSIIRQRFYHGAPPERQAEAVRQEVADLLIERKLLIEEAEKRGFQPDEARIERAVANADARYGAAPQWQKQREALLPGLKEQVAQQSLYEQIEKKVRDVPLPTAAEVRAYYDQNPELFTEPEKLHMSMIVLKVDPGAPREDWAKAREEMHQIMARIKDGADFADMARQYSTDKSASNGGDLGYVHGGMLSENLQAKIDKFQIGEMTDPVTILEGVAIYRLDGRQPSKLREFAEVEQRAQDLLQRDRVDQAWKDTVNHLRAAAKIEILAPLASGSTTQDENAK